MGSGTNTANLAWNGFTYPKLSYRCSKNLWDLLNCLLDFFCCHFKDNKTIRCNTLPNSVLFSYGLYRCPNVSLYHELFLYFQGSWWSMMNPWNWWKPRDLCSGSSSRSTGHMLMSSRLIHFEICLLFCFSRLSVSNISSVTYKEATKAYEVPFCIKNKAASGLLVWRHINFAQLIARQIWDCKRKILCIHMWRTYLVLLSHCSDVLMNCWRIVHLDR